MTLCKECECVAHPPDWDFDEDTEESYVEDDWIKCKICDGYFEDDGCSDILYDDDRLFGDKRCCHLCGKTKDIIRMKKTGEYICHLACDESDDESDDESYESACDESDDESSDDESSDDETDDESEEEYEYTRFGTKHKKYGYCVAGGGLMNGNACAYVKKKGGFYWYNEYGKNPTKQRLGKTIIWDEEKFSFNIV